MVEQLIEQVHTQETEVQPELVVSLEGAQIAQGDNLILTNVSLEMRAGDFVYLVGRVGSGKSSLIETLTGQIPLAGGCGTVCGYDLERLRRRQVPYLRRRQGVVFQDFQLLMDRSVEKNLLFALRATGWKDRAAIRRRIAEVLERVGLTKNAAEMPAHLSGGERQRVAIARALLNEPQLILADEPTGNLDPETSEGILMILRDLAQQGKSVLMATHNYALVSRYPERTLQCQNGRLNEIECQLNVELGDMF